MRAYVFTILIVALVLPSIVQSLSLKDVLAKRRKCSPVLCRMYCVNGFKKNRFGCAICSCAPPICPRLLCRKMCPYGRQKNKKGCLTCLCKPRPICRRVKCLKFCLYGRLHKNGCPTCICKRIAKGPRIGLSL